MASSKTKPATSPASIAGIFYALLVWEAVIAVLKARARPFWYDEIFTLDLSSIHSFSRLMQALKTGVDAMPLTYDLIVHWASLLPIDPRIAVRLPSVLGYVLTLLGVYWFARHRLSVLAGLAAVLLTALSPLRAYAVEGRSYALMVGFFAMAVLCWQRIGEKRFMALWFGLFLTLSVATHYYAVVAIGVFAVAEIVRYFVEQRRIRWAVWIACGAATLPFLTALPILLAYRNAVGQHYWSQATWGMAISTYGEYIPLGPYVSAAVAALIGVGLILLVARSWRRSEATPSSGFTASEIALLAALVFYPAALATLTTILRAGYVARYAWPAILGIVLGVTYLLRQEPMRPRWASSIQLAGVLLIVVGLRGFVDVGALWGGGADAKIATWSRLSNISQSDPSVPVVIGSGLEFLEAVEYAPPSLRPRLMEVADPDTALRILGTDAIDRVNLLLAQLAPLHIEDLAGFEAAHSRFFLRSGRNPDPSWDWITSYLRQRQYHFQLLAKEEGSSAAVYLVGR